MIKLYFANPGAGKSTLLAKLAQTENKPYMYSCILHMLTGRRFPLKRKYDKIYCNKPIFNTLKYDVEKDMGKKHIENALILIDEGAVEMDNRVPLTKAQKTFLRMHRHYKCDIVVVSQSWEDINIVVRRLYDKIYLMNRTPIKLKPMDDLTVIRQIKKTIGITEEGQIVDMYRFVNPLFGFRLFYRAPWYRFFNSYDKEQLKTIPDVEYEGRLPDTKLVANYKSLRSVVFKLWKNLAKGLNRVKKGQPLFGIRRARTPLGPSARRSSRSLGSLLKLDKDKKDKAS